MTAKQLEDGWVFVEIHFVNDEMLLGFIPHNQFKSLQMEVDRDKGYTLTFVHEFNGRVIEGQIVFNNRNLIYMKSYRRGTTVFDDQAKALEVLPDTNGVNHRD